MGASFERRFVHLALSGCRWALQSVDGRVLTDFGFVPIHPRRTRMQERDAVPSRCEADPDIQVMLNGPRDIVASLPLPHEGNPRAPRWPAPPPEHMCNCRNGRGEGQTASCPFKSLLAYAKRLLLRVPRRGSRRQHAEDNNNDQVDAMGLVQLLGGAM